VELGLDTSPPPLEWVPGLMKPHWEKKFRRDIHHPQLLPLLHVVDGLVREDPWERLSAAEALEAIETDGRSLEKKKRTSRL
jgi:hypothetical protein